jgi:hypothetical protein
VPVARDGSCRAPSFGHALEQVILVEPRGSVMPVSVSGIHANTKADKEVENGRDRGPGTGSAVMTSTD